MHTKWYAYGTHIGLIPVSYIEKIDRQTKRIDKLMVIHSKKNRHKDNGWGYHNL